MNTCLRSVAIGMLAMAALSAEDSGSRRVGVRGEIQSMQPFGGSLTVELAAGNSGIPERAMVNPDGTFEFPSAPVGIHQLRVIGPQGAILHQEMVTIGNVNQVMSIRLPDPPPNASRSMDGNGGGSISVRQLTHKVPPAARKAYDKGEQSAAKSQHFQAAESFRQAVTIDPEFVDAYNQLGAAEAAMGNLAKAAEQFQKAVDLAPEHPQALPNLCIVLAKMRRFPEAGAVARRALKVAPGSGPLHYILGVSILMANGDRDEIMMNLERSTAEVPKAHLLAASLLEEWGRSAEAAQHLQDYLRDGSPDTADRARVEGQLARLQGETQQPKE
jgi:tetratricopeptide (TPR) repeat protein